MNFKWGTFRWHFCYPSHIVGAKTQKFSLFFSGFQKFHHTYAFRAYIFENITCIMANAIYLVLRIFTFRALFGVICISHYKPMADNDAHWGGACTIPRGTSGRIYKEDHYTLLHTKYESAEPCGIGEDLFYVFPIVSLWELSVAMVTRGLLSDLAQNLMQPFQHPNDASDKI